MADGRVLFGGNQSEKSTLSFLPMSIDGRMVYAAA
jgi:hypothetical protein